VLASMGPSVYFYAKAVFPNFWRMIIMAKPIFDSEENTGKESILISKRAIRLQKQEIQYPMFLKVMSDQETKEYHLKKLERLSVKALGEIPQLDEPTYEQKKWVLGRLRQSSKHWRRWCE
jgi:hypothetical protein